MGQKKIRVQAKDGTALAFKPVKVQMQRHEFLFGAGMFDAVAYASGEMKEPAHREAFEQSFEKWQALMNNATLPFYWGGFEPEEGKPRTAQVMAGAKFLKERGVTLKGHPLCWHTGCADWLMKYSNAEIIRKQVERIKRDVLDFAGAIDMWDVINEVVIMPVFDKYDNAVTRICKELGRVKTVKTMFDAARETNPDAKLLINDFNLSQSYQILIDGCLNSGVPIDEIGLQTHMHQGYMGIDRLEEVLARYEVFGLPLHFTEITLTSGIIMPPEIVDLNDYKNDDWQTTPEFEDRQAREFTEMYEILFAHPLVCTAYSWSFTDGGWLNAPAGLLRKDGSAKPAYDALYELIRGKWWTDTEVVTDENGEAIVEGFCGDYKLTCLDTEFDLALRKGQLDGVKTIIV
ncbi:MAG: endo-1,4-beta-xylanase [Ruminococcus sp.]|jgi:GH35 family endo-1,4-beta-xylanase|nr:endo-1,4-beta-xylanase [Ruminococcus sp.]